MQPVRLLGGMIAGHASSKPVVIAALIVGLAHVACGESLASATASLPGWVGHGRLDKMQRLLELQADVTAQDESGGTPLHTAARRGHFAATTLLLEWRALPDAMDVDGLRPMHWAALHGHLSAATALLNARALLSEPSDKFGQLPIHLAAREGATDVVAALLSHGASINALDSDGASALSWAAFGGHQATVDTLLEFRADVDGKDEAGQTPLHWAARGHVGATKSLLEYRANPENLDHAGKAPSYWASNSGHKELLKLLDVGFEIRPEWNSATRQEEGVRVSRRRASQPWVVEVEL